MTWIDWAIVAVLLFFALQGLRRGPLPAAAGLLGVAVAYLLASLWYPDLAEGIRRSTRLPEPWVGTVAFAALLVGLYAVIGTVATLLLGEARLSARARLIGLLVGAGEGAVLAVALLAVALASPLSEPLQQDVARSTMAPYAVRAHRASVAALASVLPPALRPFGAGKTRF